MNTQARSAPNVKSLTILKRFAKAGQSIKLKVFQFQLEMKETTNTSLNLLTVELIQCKNL